MRNYIRHIVFALTAVMVLMLCVNVIAIDLRMTDTSHKQTNTEDIAQRQSFIESATIPSPSQGYELARNPNSFSQITLRNFNGSNLFRIQHYSLVEQQKLLKYRLFYLHKHALNKSGGYYLFHLRKLLI